MSASVYIANDSYLLSPLFRAKPEATNCTNPTPRQRNHASKKPKRENKAKLPYTATAIFCHFRASQRCPAMALVASGDLPCLRYHA
jgi:hypothetical protein